MDLLIPMISSPTARGELPRFYELDPLKFQGLCRDLYQVEPEISTAEVFGVPGQPQRGVDVVATRREDSGICVGQCKRVQPDALTPALIRGASKEFLDHIAYWKERDVRRFVLFVAPDASRAEIQEEYLRQREAFRKIGIEYELWGAATIQNKLRPQPGITSTYLGDYWKDILCGTGVSGFPRESLVVDSILRTQLDALASHVSTAGQSELADLRAAWRRGRRADVAGGLAQLREPSRWQVFPASLRASIVRFEAQLALEQNDVERARQLSGESAALDPSANVRLEALIARADDRPNDALIVLETASDIESRTLRAAILMETGRVSEALSALESLSGHAEAHRLRALGFVLQRDLAVARLEAAKAFELAPDWQATRYTRATVNYLSGLSPAVLPAYIPQWPEPDDWHFVRTDDQSRALFGRAALDVTELESQVETNEEERRVYEAWHVACLANDPERRDEATKYCIDVLARDPGHYRVVAWALSRRLEADLAPSERVLRERIAHGDASPPEVISLGLMHIQNDDEEAAQALFEETRPLFVARDAEDLWRFWTNQLAAARGEAVPETSSAEIPQAVLVRLRAASIASGNWEPLIAELQRRADEGDGRAAFEVCEVLGSLQRWVDALPHARIVVDRVSTADALVLACGVFYNAKHYDECLQQLDSRRDLFPHGELPTQAQRLRLAAQRELGLLPAATAAAEDLFRREPSLANFKVLADLYFEKGDFPSLVVLARRHEQFEDLSNTDLLRLSMRIAIEDRGTAASLWRRAVAKGVTDEEVPIAVEIGYKLGLDKELRLLTQRFAGLAANPEGQVRQMGFEQVKEMLIARRNDIQRVYHMYTTGQVPIHLAAQHFRRPLVSWYHRGLLMNEESGRSVTGPTFVRSGWRIGQSLTFEADIALRVHVDLTALLLAFHFNILDKIKATFGPLILPHRTLIALAEMQDATRPVQPARLEALRVVQDAVNRNVIRVEQEPDDQTSVAEKRPRSNRRLGMARQRGWLLVDFLPLTDEDARPVVLPENDERLLRSGHAVVEALRSTGEISDAQVGAAFDALGLEHVRPLQREIPKGATLLASAGVLELLASGAVLEATVRAFSVRIDRTDFDLFVVNELLASQAAESDAQWLSTLIDHVRRGIDDGSYQLLPDIEHQSEALPEEGEQSPSTRCLLDLLRFSPAPGDVIWTDDRWLTGFVHRDGIPVVDTLDLLHLLRGRGLISVADFGACLQRFRESDLRFIAVDSEEVKELAGRGQLEDGRLSETREVRTLRRYYARSLAHGEVLRVAPVEQGYSLEWPFLMASGASVIKAIVEVWKSEAPDAARIRAEWILRNMYSPDRGRGFTRAERTSGVDHHLEAVALSALLTQTITFDRGSSSRIARRAYLEWIYHRLIRRRFEADPNLKRTTLDAFKQLMSQSVDTSTKDVALRRVAAALIRLLVADLPDELGTALAEDGEFLAKLEVSRYPVVRVGPHQLKADELWSTASTVLRTHEAIEIVAGQNNLAVKLLQESKQPQLVVEDTPARKQYVLLHDVLGLLSDSIAERESALRGISNLLDLPRDATNDAVARIALLDDPARRVMEIARLRGNSAQSDYVELERKLKSREQVGESDFMVEDPSVIARHLRLPVDGNESLQARLEIAAATLIEEVGLDEAIVRLAGLPVALPTVILTRIDGLAVHDRRSLLKRLLQALGSSPLGGAHVLRLFGRYASERPSYARYLRAGLRARILGAEDERVAAWLEILRLYGNDFCYMEAFRRLPVDVRLCIAWTHGDRVFRIIANAGADLSWVLDHFGSWSTKLPAEIAFIEDDYTRDVCNLRRIDETMFALAGCAYATDFGAALESDLRAWISAWVEAEPARLLAVMRDSATPSDTLSSILRYDGQASGLFTLTSKLQDRFSPAALQPQIVAAIEGIRSGQAGLTEWGVVNTMVRDHALPSELAPAFREGLLATDLVSLHRTDSTAALIAAIVAAQHAGRLGQDVVTHVRTQLEALAAQWNAQSGASKEEIERAANVLVSAAFHLSGSDDARPEGSRFEPVAELLERLVGTWSAIVDSCQFLIDRLVDGLANADSRSFWQLQVKLRSVR